MDIGSGHELVRRRLWKYVAVAVLFLVLAWLGWFSYYAAAVLVGGVLYFVGSFVLGIYRGWKKT
jgi:uncharacterized membrane protein